MTWKAGDTVALVAYLESASGVPQVYASYAAFVAAGWSLTFYSAAVALSSQPTITLAPISTGGIHSLSFILPSGVDSLIFNPPSGMRSDPAFQVLIVPSQDTDSLAINHNSFKNILCRPFIGINETICCADLRSGNCYTITCCESYCTC